MVLVFSLANLIRYVFEGLWNGWRAHPFLLRRILLGSFLLDYPLGDDITPHHLLVDWGVIIMASLPAIFDEGY